jgi:hypothetical protein
MPLPPATNTQKILKAFIRYQYAANANLTLGQIDQLNYESYQLHPGILAFLTQERERIRQTLLAELHGDGPARQPSLISLFVSTTQEFIYQQNQFVSLSAEDQTELVTLYRQFLADTANILVKDQNTRTLAQLYQAVLEDHFHCLKTFITNLGQTQGANLIYRHVVCAEYPALLQLDLLGLNSQTLLEPILDVGCGKQGTLVTYLRQQGLDASGIDRLVKPSAHLTETDWLSFQFVPARWGTIISHMAFSNHFIFHHLYRSGTPETYAQKFMEMLASLKTGGKMCYTPGLPFIEQLLPAAKFKVEQKNVPLRLLPVTTQTSYRNKLSQNTLYASKITKLTP